jgi:hypothetical protein
MLGPCYAVAIEPAAPVPWSRLAIRLVPDAQKADLYAPACDLTGLLRLSFSLVEFDRSSRSKLGELSEPYIARGHPYRATRNLAR